MNTYTIYITANYSSFTDNYQNQTIYSPGYIIKGQTLVTFNLSGINESIFNVGRVSFNWGDTLSSSNIVTEDYFLAFSSTTARSIVDSSNIYQHVYTPHSDLVTYFSNLSTLITIYYDESASDKALTIVTPIRIAKGSYYDDVDNFFTINTQVLPNLSSDNLINFTGSKTPFTFVSMLSN